MRIIYGILSNVLNVSSAIHDPIRCYVCKTKHNDIFSVKGLTKENYISKYSSQTIGWAVLLMSFLRSFFKTWWNES